MNYHLELKNVKKSFGPTSIIKGVNLKIRKGEIHSLIGPNGAGKSTLYNLISGVYQVSSGNIIYGDVFERDLSKSTVKTLSGLETPKF